MDVVADGPVLELIIITDPALLRWYGFGKDGQKVPTYVACTIDLSLQWWADQYWSRKARQCREHIQAP